MVERTAARMFGENGYERANLDEIAAELNLSGPSLYYYFSSKEELFLRCVESSAAEVQQRLQEIANSDGSAEDRLRLLVREQVMIELRDYPDFVPLFLRVQVPVPAIQARLAELRRQHGEVFQRVGYECADEYGIKRDEARISLLMAFGALAYLPMWYNPAGALGLEELADMVSAIVVGSFLTGRASPRR
ncbi:MAG: regulatory protein TetR [Actinoallomurus sp.]|jgi:AcrR family transcriptional regulator|nr:regulatory protein TetR [Actinoallomurus sp.]